MTYNGMREKEAREAAYQERIAAEEEALRHGVEADDQPAAPTARIVADQPAVRRPAEGIPLKEASTPDQPAEEFPFLDNGRIRVTLTSHGGAIQHVDLYDYPDGNPHEQGPGRPVRINEVADRPALILSQVSGGGFVPITTPYRIDSHTADSIRFVADLPNGLQLVRSYTLSRETDGPAPYTIQHRTELRNTSETPLAPERLYFNLGTSVPSAADPMGFNLNTSYRNDGSYDWIPSSKFRGGGFIFKSEPRERIEKRGTIQWGAVKNQFFTTIATPVQPADALIARGVRLPVDPSGREPIGITAELEFAMPTIAPGESTSVDLEFYTGPKEFRRLSRMTKGQEDVMQLGWFLGLTLGLVSFIAKAMLSLMAWIQGMVGSWGWTIILTTLVIRILLYPLTAKAARASKRMQKLSKPLQELREKYKDDQNRLNQEMMALWKRHKINPLAGCWPVLVQFPVFIAFFNLLRGASDLRYARFLWITDLSMPDATIRFGEASLPLVGSTLNVLPFVWLASMWFQMKMMPQPSIDNAQTKMIKWMPFIFFPFTYVFSSGLVLYWTTTNCFSILQQVLTNRSRDDEDVAIDEELAAKEQKNRAPMGPLIKKKKKKKPHDDNPGTRLSR
jgi:YidC/Oxa1 family membrane protein insertase